MAPSNLSLRSSAIEELCGNEARREKSYQHYPVERIGQRERSIRRKEEPIEAQKRTCGERHSKGAPSACASALHEKKVRERDMGFVEPSAEWNHRGGDRTEKHEPTDSFDSVNVLPGRHPGAAHGSFSNR